MRKIIAAAVAACAIGTHAGSGYPERWAFWNRHIETPEQCAGFSNLVEQAAKCGCTAVCFGDGMDYYSCWNERHRKTLDAAVRHIRSKGMQIVAAVWSIGYGSMLNYGYELMEGASLDDLTYVVEGAKGERRATFRPSVAENLIPNGEFERTDRQGRLTGWTFIDGVLGKSPWAFRDTQVKHGGEASICFDIDKAKASPAGTYLGMARAGHSLNLTPWKHYRFTAWVKTENLKVKGQPFKIALQREGVEGKSGFGVLVMKPEGESQDWTRLSFEFNSLDATSLRAWAGVWGGVSGRFWMDDVRVEEVAPKAVLHNFGSPLTVVRRRDGKVLTEGLHFTVTPPLTSRKWSPDAPGVELLLPEKATKWLKAGDELSVSCCTPSTSGSDSPDQVSLCLSDPALYNVLRRSAETLQAAIAPDQWLIGFDEVRNGNTFRACRARGVPFARIMGESVSNQSEIVKAASPGSQVWVWSDMFCPWENAVENYYSVRGSCVGGVDFLPKGLGIACWGSPRHAAKSMALFASRGHRTLAAAFYDESAELNGTRKWLDAMNATPLCAGTMYTTWRGDYSLMEPFWKLASEKSAPLAANAPRKWRDRWIFEHTKLDSKEEAEDLADYVRRAAKKGCNGFALIVGDDYMCRRSAFKPRPSKSWAAGWEDCDQWDDAKKANWRIVKDALDSTGIELVPLVWSLGYASPTHADAGFVSVQQTTNAPYVAKGGSIVFDAPPPVALPEGASAEGEGRMSFTLPVKPLKTYRFSFMVKFENLADKGESFRFSFYNPETGESRSWARPNWWFDHKDRSTTMDWHRVEYDVNSGTGEAIRCFLGLRKHPDEVNARLMWKDFSIREIGFQTPIARKGAPFVVADADTGRIYRPGKDYEVPALPEDLTFGCGAMRSFRIPAGSAIRDGRRLLVSGYEPICEWGVQFSTCLNHPDLNAYFAKSAERVQKAFAPKKWFFSMDEFRCGCRCELCRRDRRTMGKQLSAVVNRMREAVRRVSPEAEVYMWPDMFDPEINARAGYYQLPSTAAGSWLNLPKDIIMANWGCRPRNSYQFFSRRGFRTQCATYYDEDGTLKFSRQMLDAASKTPNCTGWTYTPWAHSRDLLENFVDLANTYMPVTAQTIGDNR